MSLCAMIQLCEFTPATAATSPDAVSAEPLTLSAVLQMPQLWPDACTSTLAASSSWVGLFAAQRQVQVPQRCLQAAVPGQVLLPIA